MYKTFLNKFLFSLLSIYIIVIVTVNILIDPNLENAFIKHKLNAKTFSRTLISSQILYDKLKDNKYSLIFGTSRSAKISSKMLHANLLNFSLSLYGNPKSIQFFLNSLDKNQVNQLISFINSL